MLNLTKQERLVLIFFACVFFIGTSLHYTFKKSAPLEKAVSLIEGDKLYPKIDINTASYQELLALPSVGPVTARRIIDYRSQHGPLSSLEELKMIDGIGNSSYKKMVKFLKTPFQNSAQN